MSKLYQIWFCHLYENLIRGYAVTRLHSEKFEEAVREDKLALVVGSALVLVVGIRRVLWSELEFCAQVSI